MSRKAEEVQPGMVYWSSQIALDKVDTFRKALIDANSRSRIELLELEPSRFPREEGRELISVQHVMRLVTCDVLLQQEEAVQVDRPPEEPCKSLPDRAASRLAERFDFFDSSAALSVKANATID